MKLGELPEHVLAEIPPQSIQYTDGKPLTCAEIIDSTGVSLEEVAATHARGAATLLEHLPLLAAERRALLGLTLREAAAQIGVGFNSLSRLERSVGTVSLTNAAAVLRWLDSTASVLDQTGDPR